MICSPRSNHTNGTNVPLGRSIFCRTVAAPIQWLTAWLRRSVVMSLWTCSSLCIYMYTYIHIIYIYLYTYIYTYTYLCNLYLYLSIYISIYISIYLYIYTHTNIYICIYIIYRVFTFPPEADEISFTMEDEDPFFFRHDSLLPYRHEAWEDWESCWGFP